MNNIKRLILSNVEYPNKTTFGQCIYVCAMYFSGYGFYILGIDDTCIEQWDEQLALGEITIDDINKLNDAVHKTQKWLKDYTDKNFKELSDDEKLYMELGD